MMESACLTRICKWGAISVVVLFLLLLAFPLFDQMPLQLAGHLLFGGFSHVWASVPHMVPSFSTLMGFGVLLTLSICALQVLLAKFAKSKQGPGFSWQPRWTLSVVGLVLAAIGTACATVGLAHHAVWLTRDKFNYFDSGMGPGRQSRGNCHQLILCLRMYSENHGGVYPKTLEELVTVGICTPEELAKYRMFYATDGVAVPFIYLTGLSYSKSGDLPLVVSPLPISKDRYIVGRNDSIVEMTTRGEYEEAMVRYRSATSGGGDAE